ncbi:unnamed protein product [Durusdinium trenchii]|uniref:Uncharacterized protein n=1 Tax=Durusdinium trenchii TaxID=1381693 RepID=A0ABP0RTR4_9DINO
MAKRLVMGPSPGTGLFVHEPRASKSRYSRESKDDGKSMADQEEEKINGRLVEILERKCAKLRSRAEQEEKNRKTLQEELEELRPRCEELQREVCDLRAAHEKLAEDRQEALRRNGELANIQQQCWALRVPELLCTSTAALEVLRQLPLTIASTALTLTSSLRALS